MSVQRWKWFALPAFLVLVWLHLGSLPRTLWEYDEGLFALGVERFEPLLHHPPPPGYPLYMGFAKLVALLSRDAFQALLVTSILSLLAGVILYVLAFREVAGDAITAVVAAILFYGSPAMLVSGVLPQSDSGAIALFGLAIWACARGNPVLIGVACAAAIGWRLQLSIAVVPMFLVTAGLLRPWRERFLAVGTFSVACLAWFIPLVAYAGGFTSYWGWLAGQAAYYGAHDADLSRSGTSSAQIALRFLAHPWGPKWLAVPVMVAATAGALALLRRLGPERAATLKRYAPLAAGSVAYYSFALATMDPADAVRYAIPALPFVALLAAVSLRRLPWLVVLYVAGAFWYASPVLRARATSDSPPAAAAAWIEANVPRGTVIVQDAPLRPHGQYLLRDWKRMREDPDPAIPMVIFADGERGNEKGVSFRWPDTDAYRKLTRKHYGAVSVIPVPSSQRYRVIEGVFPAERLRNGTSWRWMGARAVIELPDLGATRVRIVLRAPPEYPLARNSVRVKTGTFETSATLQPDTTAAVVLPLSAGPSRITLTPEQSFVPARISAANNRDRRTLSVMIVRVEQLDPRSGAE